MDVKWTIPALDQLDAIQDHIALDNTVAAYALTSDIFERTEQLLAVNPLAGRAGRVVGTREWVMPDTTYIVVYRVTRYVEILAVIHTAREWPETF